MRSLAAKMRRACGLSRRVDMVCIPCLAQVTACASRAVASIARTIDTEE
jgi:hypothetical protein